jgi:plastocyanin
LLAAVVLLAAGCGGYGGKSKSTSSESSGGGGSDGKKTIAGVAANDHGSKSVGDEAGVELDDYYFEPTVLRGKPGSKVKLELENEGSTEHNFSIDSQSVDQDVEAGEDAKVTVTFPKSGVLSFYCKYHRDKGMAGALAVGAGNGTTSTDDETTTEDTTTGRGY